MSVIQNIYVLYIHVYTHMYMYMCVHVYTFMYTCAYIIKYGASLVAQMVKNAPTMQEIQGPSLSQKDPLEKGKATHCSILT